jgi:hypothetical protein
MEGARKIYHWRRVGQGWSRECRNPDVSQPCESPQPVTGTVLLYFFLQHTHKLMSCTVLSCFFMAVVTIYNWEHKIHGTWWKCAKRERGSRGLPFYFVFVFPSLFVSFCLKWWLLLLSWAKITLTTINQGRGRVLRSSSGCARFKSLWVTQC